MGLEHGGDRVGDGDVRSKKVWHGPIIPVAIRIVQNGLVVYVLARTHFTVAGAILGGWCIGWAASKLIDRWIQRAGRRPRGWVRLLLIVAGFLAMLSLQYFLPIRTAYSQGLIVGCAVIVVNKIEKALLDDGNERGPV
jgi:hypothetical protein